MCGICGLIDIRGNRQISLQDATKRMTDLLAHRGPDASGIWHDKGISLGHRRLSIIDLEGSVQPMVDSTGRYVIVFNGEIYNYVEIRSELKKRGIEFRTNGDTEVLLQSFIIYGTRCLELLNGMFAFAIWDRQTRTLFAARDRLGVKPFYYGIDTNGFFAFSSELQAMRSLPFDFSIKASALNSFLKNGFIRSPDTIFNGVNELRPAHFIIFGDRGLRIERYWSPPFPSREMGEKGETVLLQELEELVLSSVKLRLRSDVDLGAFLSGGLDSSVIVAAMKKIGTTDIHTFSIGFDSSSFDESPYAREVAQYLGTIHHEKKESLDPATLLLDLVKHYGQPYGDSSAIPTWHLCKETKRYVTVALSGDGGDELFCGYRRYLARRFLSLYRKIPAGLRHHLINRLIKKLPETTEYYDKSLIKKLRLFAELDKRVSKDPSDIYPAYFVDDERERLLGGKVSMDEETNGMAEWFQRHDNMSDIDLMMRADILYYLPDDILTKVDRASMAHGLEVRSPFMDYRVVEFAMKLPLSYKLRGTTSKYILRRAFSKSLPETPLKRRKHGFAVPVGDWFKKELKDVFREVVLSSGNTIVNKKEATHIFDIHQRGHVDHGHKLWLILFLEIWYRWWQSTTVN